MPKNKFKYRDFLEEGAESYVVAWFKREGRGVDADLKVADCQRSVSLSFSVGDYSEDKDHALKSKLKGKLAKLNKLKFAISKIENVLTEALNELETKSKA